MDGDIYDQFGEAIDRRLGGVRAEAQRRAAAGPPPPTMFRLWQEKEEPPFGVEEVGSDEEVTQGLRGGSETENAIIIESDDEEEGERMEPPSVLFEKMKDLLDKMGRHQQKLVGLCKEVKGWRSNIPTVFLYDSGPESAPGRPGVNVVRPCPQPGIRGRPLTPQARLAQAARTRNQAKASTSQEPPRGEHEPGRRKKTVEVEDDDDEEEEDERLRREEDQRAEQRARKKGIRGEAEPVIKGGPPKKKKYVVRLEEGFDVEKVIDRLLEGHNDLMNLKEILASALRLRDELEGRLSRRLVPNVHLGTILPKEAEWAESGTKMDWKCVACGTVDLMVKGSKCAAMVDTGAEMNIIREADAIRFGLDIDRYDCGILHGASCKAVFCGTASNVLVEVGKVKARACFFIMPDVDHEILLERSDFTKTAMPRGGKGTRPPQRPLGASGGYERHGPRQRESTLVYNDGDIELFLDSFWEHARCMGWTVTQAIERLRGAGRFEEPIARIRREATTRQEVEIRMEELRPSPVGPDGRPIRLEIGNASDFIPAFEWFMQEQGIQRDDWMQTLPLWTRKAERPLAMQIRDMARDWESCRAHLREAFRRPELPQPRVERRQRSQRPRDPEPKEARPSRGGRKTLARREQEPEDEERGAYPECGLGPGEEHGEQAEEASREEVPREEVPQGEIPREEMSRKEVPQEKVQGTQRERGLGGEGRYAGKEVIEVGKDTPQQTPAVGLRLGGAPGSTRQAREGLQREETPLPSSEKASSPEGRAERRREMAAVRREALILIDRHLAAHALEHPDLEEPAPAEPRQELCQPEKEMEAEIPKRVDLRMRERVPAGETAEEKRARRTRRIDEIWQEMQRLEAAGEVPEQQQERQRSEAAGALPGQPPSAPAKAPEIPEMWRDFWEQRGEELPSPVRAGFGVARKAEERLDPIIESLRQQTQGKVDRPESSRQGEQRQPGQRLPGQPSATEPRQEPSMGIVILEPEEARAQRQAEREAFEFRASTELATLPVAAAGPVVRLAVEEGLPPSSSEPTQGSAEGSTGVLLEAVHTMQEEVSLFSPEQRIEEPLEREMGIEEEGAIEGRLQKIGTPEYGPEEIEEQPTAVPGAALERRPQRLDTPEYVPATEDLRGRLGFRATGSGSGGPIPGTERQKVIGTAAPQAEHQGVISTLAESPSSPPPQPRKKKYKRKVDQLCFYCKKSAHHALDCLEFLEDKAAGKISEVGSKMYDR
ncbi:hypothetical protein CBR_g52673 [Chara braunii]|uniref:Peptidase A2 domain-containing protein n=1 Tax=Chara braunii TaxID=69332 RepID=A0A388MB09_CHABU|nr:hypothetical protein CBR_g52673 [Chara braunii]|eukprot:GBG91639.1 hypothetical protein CBR_g52673 [Chara braunii]